MVFLEQIARLKLDVMDQEHAQGMDIVKTTDLSHSIVPATIHG
jgi:hypothetical protein